MIKIIWNREVYEIVHKGKNGDTTLACADYDSSIGEHVGNIYEVLATLGIEVVLEEL